MSSPSPTTAVAARNRTPRWIWIVLAVSVVLVAVWEWLPQMPPDARIDRFPARGQGFVSRDVALTDLEKGVFGKARVLKRLYQVGRDRAFVQIIDPNGDSHAVHDPRYCFRGAGWEVVRERAVPLPGGAAVHLVLSRRNEAAEAVYWFTDGKVRHGSPLRFWWDSAQRRILRDPRSELLVILQPIPGETLDWDDFLNRFEPLGTL